MELDDADIRILQALQEDARLSFRDLAGIAGVSTPTASSKVKALEAKGVIRGYRADVSPAALGEQVFILDIRAKPGDLRGVAEKLGAMPQVRACYVAGTGRVFAFATLIDASSQGDFLAEVSAVPHVQSADALPLLQASKELPSAIVDRGVALAVRCEFCGKMTKREVVRLRFEGVTHFVCCKNCKAGLAQRLKRLAATAGTPATDLPVVDG